MLMDIQNTCLTSGQRRSRVLDKIVGLKYFNVYGPNEYHKEDMRSVVNKCFHQIKETGKARLFKSAKSGL